MFTRSILIPSLVAVAVASPIMFSEGTKTAQSPDQASATSSYQVGFERPGSPSPFFEQASSPGYPSTAAQPSLASQHAPIGNPIFQGNQLAGIPVSNPALVGQSGHAFSPVAVNSVPAQASFPSGIQVAPQIVSEWPGATIQPDVTGMVPDIGAAQTLVFPGNAHGPDFSAPPLEFIPVGNFEEIFRFDISPTWVRRRWKRVSTNPGDQGLHGLRVALVTGTNSWDLHGSLTYFFDANQRLQRITFRGWTGDESRLTNLLTQRYGFKTQPTHWAGFYLAQRRRQATGALLMQHPTVIYTENPVQQVALVMEINNPQGNFSLSGDFQTLIQGSQTQ